LHTLYKQFLVLCILFYFIWNNAILNNRSRFNYADKFLKFRICSKGSIKNIRIWKIRKSGIVFDIKTHLLHESMLIKTNLLWMFIVKGLKSKNLFVTKSFILTHFNKCYLRFNFHLILVFWMRLSMNCID